MQSMRDHQRDENRNRPTKRQHKSDFFNTPHERVTLVKKRPFLDLSSPSCNTLRDSVASTEV
jgi:hypothetical protein